jgi:pyrroloquinoline quinone biosynthesis protein B
MFEATPDFREQLRALHEAPPRDVRSNALPVDGIFLTHAHMGHYTGLMFLGHESMGARGVPVYAMPRLAGFLETNGPWSQLVRLKNIEVRGLEAGSAVECGTSGVRVTPVVVPHRQEYSEVVGYRIEGPRRRVLFIPDIDSWEQWDAMGVRLEDELARVDVAYLDGTFFANGEIPGRDMTGFPHPFITRTMERLAGLPSRERAKVRFIHLNHTNPALWPGRERDAVEAAGFAVAEEGERVGL